MTVQPGGGGARRPPAHARRIHAAAVVQVLLPLYKYSEKCLRQIGHSLAFLAAYVRGGKLSKTYLVMEGRIIGRAEPRCILTRIVPQ